MTPCIYVLAKPIFTEAYAEFLATENLGWKDETKSPAERLIEFAGRICYMSFGSRQRTMPNSAYIANLIRQGHESVLEHANWTFLLTDVSRAFTHQLVRHRAGFSFSQLSQQYYDESDAQFLMPDGIEKFPKAHSAWQRAMDSALEAYRTLLAEMSSDALPDSPAKEANRALRTAARSALPNATSTKIVVTANARALRHFLNVRGGLEGDIEMRLVSKLIYDMLLEEAPSLVADFSVETLSDGSPKVVMLDDNRGDKPC